MFARRGIAGNCRELTRGERRIQSAREETRLASLIELVRELYNII